MDRRGDMGQQAGSFLTGFLDYLKSRQPEHWLFFAVGLIVGLLLG